MRKQHKNLLNVYFCHQVSLRCSAERILEVVSFTALRLSVLLWGKNLAQVYLEKAAFLIFCGTSSTALRDSEILSKQDGCVLLLQLIQTAWVYSFVFPQSSWRNGRIQLFSFRPEEVTRYLKKQTNKSTYLHISLSLSGRATRRGRSHGSPRASPQEMLSAPCQSCYPCSPSVPG